MTVDRGTQLLDVWRNSTAGASQSTASVGSIANTASLFVGRNSTGTLVYFDGEIDQIVVFKGTALNSTQIGQIMTYLGV
jgi:hypothetical protein